MSTEVHKGPGVLRGRYAGPAIEIHHGPTPQHVAVATERSAADTRSGRIWAAAAMSAQSECQLLELIGEFDEISAIRWWADVKFVGGRTGSVRRPKSPMQPPQRSRPFLRLTAMPMHFSMWPGRSLTRCPENRSGEDRTMVVVHVSADNLSRQSANRVPREPPNNHCRNAFRQYR
jgi:hypothetical protein